MIYVNMRGRAGNQLFIYAFARSVQEITKQKLIFCTSMMRKENPDFTMDLEEFVLSNNLSFDNYYVFPWYANNDCLVTKFFRKIMPKVTYNILSKRNIFLWLGETYVEISPDVNKDIYIDGFWQSSQYFNQYRDIILKELKSKKEICEDNYILLEQIKHSESICVTVRRGDYVGNAQKEYYVCDEKYFEKSICKMNMLVTNAKWFVFSDDIEWAKEALKFPGETYYESGKDSISEKLYMMSQCKHFIISNSSFSWWAQYMCTYNDKIVIAPSKWYVDGRKCDIYEDGWKLIEV